MKREFLVSVFLLSAGLLLVGGLHQSLPELWAQQDPTAETPRVARAGLPDSETEIADNASIQSFVRSAAAHLANSPPLEARLRYKVNMFGQEFSGPGRYLQAGQGTRKTRIEFQFGFNDTAVELHQFCDGDFLYSLTRAAGDSTLEYVDLRQLDALQKKRTAGDGNVANWLSVGSLAGLLQQAAEHFEFTSAETGQLDQIQVVHCTGRWRANALGRLMHDQIPVEATSGGVVRWQQLPEHLPHQIRLTIGSDQRFPGFPYRIVFEKFQLRDGVQEAYPVAVLELFELRVADDLSDETFGLPSINSVPVDATDFYKHRIRQFTR